MVNKTIKYILTSLLSLVNLAAISQDQSYIDSLASILETTMHDTTRAVVLGDLGMSFLYTNPDTSYSIAIKEYEIGERLAASSEEILAHSGRKQMANALNVQGLSFFMKADYHKALEYYHKSLEISEEIRSSANEAFAKEGKKAIATNYINMGIIYKNHGDYPMALEYYHKSLKISRELANMSMIASNYGSLGFIYKISGDYPNALNYCLKALKIQEELGNKRAMANYTGNIGIIFYDQGDYDKALEYYQKSYQLAQELGALNTMANALNNIGGIYTDQKDYPKALKSYHEALSLVEELGNKAGIAMIYGKIGLTYSYYEDYIKALEYYNISLEIRIEIQDMNGIAHGYKYKGDLYVKLNKMDSAYKYLSKALDIAKELEILVMEESCYQSLTELFELKHEYQKAYEYHKLFSEIKDSVFNKENSRQIADMETKYQTEKKEQEIAYLEKENEVKSLELENETTLRYSMGVGFVFILLLSSLLYNRYRIQQKKDSLEEKQVLLSQINQHQKSMINAIVNAQEDERERIAKELHDGLGGLLSTVRLNLDNFKSKYLPSKKQDEALLTKSINLVDDVCADLRTVSHDMMPGVLIKLGLPAGIKDFTDKVAESGNIKIDLDIVGLDERLDHKKEVIIYRLIQEAVNNVVKHAEANTINIQLVKHENELSVIIEDDGKGFDVTTHSEGKGIQNMESRMKFLEGKLVFDSTPGRGASVILEIPI